MNVIVSSGFAICNGCLKFEETNRTLSITASDSNYDRIDTVVMRLNDNDAVRSCDLYIVAGTPALSPVRPELNRQSSVWEIGLADLFIAKNTSIITNARITDTRLETARCGVISSVSEWDTTTIYEQIQDDLAGFKSGEEAEFLAWFQNLQDILDENTAAHLQNEIGTLSQLTTTDKTSLVAAINWLHANMSTTAEDTSYDNTESGMVATNVQGAIDELTNSFGGVQFGIDGEGNRCYLGADGSLIPFKSGFIFIGGMFHTDYVNSANYTYDFSIEKHNTDVVDFSSRTITFKKSGKHKLTFVKGQMDTSFTIRLVINGTTIHTMSFGSNSETKEYEFNVNKGDALILKIDHSNTTAGFYDSAVLIE